MALKKTLCGSCGRAQPFWYDRKRRRIRDLSCGDTRVYLEFEVRRVKCASCGKVKTERIDFLADQQFYIKRFAWHIGRRCRHSPISAVAKEFKLDWQTVKSLDKQYMAEQLKRARMPGPKAIGINSPALLVRQCLRSSPTRNWSGPSIPARD